MSIVLVIDDDLAFDEPMQPHYESVIKKSPHFKDSTVVYLSGMEELKDWIEYQKSRKSDEEIASEIDLVLLDDHFDAMANFDDEEMGFDLDEPDFDMFEGEVPQGDAIYNYLRTRLDLPGYKILGISNDPSQAERYLRPQSTQVMMLQISPDKITEAYDSKLKEHQKHVEVKNR